MQRQIRPAAMSNWPFFRPGPKIGHGYWLLVRLILLPEKAP